MRLEFPSATTSIEECLTRARNNEELDWSTFVMNNEVFLMEKEDLFPPPDAPTC
jgi:hypothetical protein